MKEKNVKIFHIKKMQKQQNNPTLIEVMKVHIMLKF